MRNSTCNRRDDRFDAATRSSAQSSKRHAHVMPPRESASTIELRLSKSLEIFETTARYSNVFRAVRIHERCVLLRAVPCRFDRVNSVQCVSTEREKVLRHRAIIAEDINPTSRFAIWGNHSRRASCVVLLNTRLMCDYRRGKKSFPVESTLSVLTKWWAIRVFTRYTHPRAPPDNRQVARYIPHDSCKESNHSLNTFTR